MAEHTAAASMAAEAAQGDGSAFLLAAAMAKSRTSEGLMVVASTAHAFNVGARSA